MWETIYQFKDLKEVLAKANELKSGDQLAGLAAANIRERVAAKFVLSDIQLSNLFESPSVPYEDDEITRLAIDSIDPIDLKKNTILKRLYKVLITG